jgi:uncharacterized protein (DUF952 family)
MAPMLEIEFARGASIVREADRRSHFPILRNGPPGTFVVFPHGFRVSLPTDQIVASDDHHGRARVAFGGMRFAGLADGRLVFHRERELAPETQLSPERSQTMTLDPDWVCTVRDDGQEVWCSTVYKIVEAGLWSAAEGTGVFSGAPVDERDGFIHLSTAAQVRETAARHFAGAGDLRLVAVAAGGLDVRWERSRGDALFPHLYGTLPLRNVRWVRALPLGGNGRHLFPDLD